MPETDSTVLFLCTGNYYRSRFAEHLFNYYAPMSELPWKAFSRGLATHLVPAKAGPVSIHTLEALVARGITGVQLRSPISLAEHDLVAAQHIVALKHAEHHPLIKQNFPAWFDRVEYWQIDDIGDESPAVALPQIEIAVLDLLKRLRSV
jgi:protein-tyrosine phosphatase